MSQDQAQQAMVVLLRRVRDALDEYLRAIDGTEADAPAAQKNTADTSSAAFEEARRVVIAAVMERTGYPEEMLDLDLDIEADLGIDSIKQVAIYAAARSTWDLAPDPDFRLREHNTLRKAISYIAQRLPADASSR